MARVRQVEIRHFRGISSLTWQPVAGINCLIGPGDSGKSSVLEAIDLCLGARQSLQFTDADFHQLNVDKPITISLTLGELDDSLKSLDAYGMYLRGFDASSGTIEDEPEKDAETVLTVRLTVGSDLEPVWSLVSERAEAQGQTRHLSWSDRSRLAPTWIGVRADYHLGWRRGSVLNRVSEERVDASVALAKAAREARAAFGDSVQGQLSGTLGIVEATAKELGIPIGESIRATLDAHSVSFSGGTIGLHDDGGVPLRALGLGSMRLLVAGLQRKAAANSAIILVDEVEHGLEPHRIIRFLDSLGAKESEPPLQVFMTTHSPVALRELSGGQLFLTRPRCEGHEVLTVGQADDIQGAIRLYPEAFLAHSVIVCEGASEVGLLRGLDQYRISMGGEAIAAQGAALVDCGGGEADRPFARAAVFQRLGFRAAVVRDDDKKPAESMESAFAAAGGVAFKWRNGHAVEDELFFSLSEDGLGRLLGRAIELHGQDLVNETIKSASSNARDLKAIRGELAGGRVSAESRRILGRAARTKKAGWFKSVSWMESVACDIVGPDLNEADAGFRAAVAAVFAWAGDAEG